MIRRADASLCSVVAVAARTPVGLTVASSAAAVYAGISRVVEHPFFVTASGEPLAGGLEPTLDPELLGAQRMASLLSGTLDQLVDPLPGSVAAIPVLLALPEPRPGLSCDHVEALSDSIAGDQRFKLAETSTSGHAGGIKLLESAGEHIANGTDGIIIVAGVDSYFDAATLSWLESERRLMHAGTRGGFPPGEGSAAVAIAGPKFLRAHQVTPLATLESVATGTEKAQAKTAEGLQGQALASILTRLSRELPQASQIDELYLDLNDERARTTDWAFATLRTSGLLSLPSNYTTYVPATGDLGAASSIFNLTLAVNSIRRGTADGHVLVAASSWAGLRGMACLRKRL